jgi:3-phosphoshikimate 1-carboxyvinyltransferase
MDTYRVKTSDKPIKSKRVFLPGSKSISNRALLIASLCENKVELSNFLFSDDTRYMSSALRGLGAGIEMDKANKTCVVTPSRSRQNGGDFFLGNAGTAMRFLVSYLNLYNGVFRLDGDERMRQRPLTDLIDALNAVGCDIKSEYGNGCPPVIIKADGFKGGDCWIVGKNSSQYISSILMSAPYSRDGVNLSVTGETASIPYIEMTINIMWDFGVGVLNEDYRWFAVKPSWYKCSGGYAIEPDASSASYFLGITAILSGEVEIAGLGKNSVQGDTFFADVLMKMGCEVEWKDHSVILRSDGKLHGVDVDLNRMPDTVPTLAVVAMFADSPTVIRNVANLRIKECDRISALNSELTKLGAGVEEYPDGLKIYPKPAYKPALINTYNDHRMAMAFAMAGLLIDRVVIENPSCVSKSFPDFFSVFEDFMG